MKTESIMTVSQAAKELDITAEAVYYAIKKGHIKAVRVGYTWILSRKSVAAYRPMPRKKRPYRNLDRK